MRDKDQIIAYSSDLLLLLLLLSGRKRFTSPSAKQRDASFRPCSLAACQATRCSRCPWRRLAEHLPQDADGNLEFLMPEMEACILSKKTFLHPSAPISLGDSWLEHHGEEKMLIFIYYLKIFIIILLF
jgi:hypothetical protein